jgi:hypothetical protein
MTITLAECADFFTRNIDASAVEVVSNARLVNTVGTLIHTMVPWKWTKRLPAWVGFVAAQEWIDLPADFHTLISIQASGVVNIQKVSEEEFLALKRNVLVTPTHAVTLTHRTIGGVIKPVLAVYPTPEETVAQALLVAYRTKWVAVTDAAFAATPNAAIPIPDWLEPLWFEVMQAVLRGFEEDDNLILSGRLDLIKRGPVMRAALDHEAAIDPMLGTLPAATNRGPNNNLHLIEVPGA